MRKFLEALKEMLAGIVNIFTWPARAITNLFGLSRQAEDEPEQKGARAGTAAKREAGEEDRNALLRGQARALRRVLDARLAGEAPSKSALAKLPENIRNYALGLTLEEVQVASKASQSSLLVALVGEAIPGIRTPAEVRHDAADARRAALEVVQGGVQPTTAAKPKGDKKEAARDVDAILADMGLEAPPRRMGM